MITLLLYYVLSLEYVHLEAILTLMKQHEIGFVLVLIAAISYFLHLKFLSATTIWSLNNLIFPNYFSIIHQFLPLVVNFQYVQNLPPLMSILPTHVACPSRMHFLYLPLQEERQDVDCQQYRFNCHSSYELEQLSFLTTLSQGHSLLLEGTSFSYSIFIVPSEAYLILTAGDLLFKKSMLIFFGNLSQVAYCSLLVSLLVVMILGENYPFIQFVCQGHLLLLISLEQLLEFLLSQLPNSPFPHRTSSFIVHDFNKASVSQSIVLCSIPLICLRSVRTNQQLFACWSAEPQVMILYVQPLLAIDLTETSCVPVNDSSPQQADHVEQTHTASNPHAYFRFVKILFRAIVLAALGAHFNLREVAISFMLFQAYQLATKHSLIFQSAQPLFSSNPNFLMQGIGNEVLESDGRDLSLQLLYKFYYQTESIELLYQSNMVFLFIPNIIGYFRFIFLFAVFPLYRTNPLAALSFYALSQILDAFDGMAARYFNQSTRFGAVMDMVCDRASNGVMLAILAGLYPQYSWLFLGDIVLDLVSHWYQMYVALSKGNHHKELKSNWWLLNLYYGNKKVLFTLVAGNEIFLITAYIHANNDLLHLSNELQWLNLIGLVVGLVLFLIKKLMSVVQLISASEELVEMDLASRKEKGN